MTRREKDADSYDLIIVGGGISGLAAAYFYRQQAGKNAKILVLDNHDDFGGHAKRNEFTSGGNRLESDMAGRSRSRDRIFTAPRQNGCSRNWASRSSGLRSTTTGNFIRGGEWARGCSLTRKLSGRIGW